MAAGRQKKKKSRKEAFAENVRELIHTNPSLAALFLLCVLLIPWSIGDFVSPAVKFGCLVVAPQIWKGAVAWLTQPVLFVLLNLVVLCIWISSGSAAAAADGNEEVNLREEHVKSRESAASSMPSSSSSSGQPCLPQKKKKNSISAHADTLRVELYDGNPESSALELPSKEMINKTPWKAFLEQKTPSWTSYSDHERSTQNSSNEESESVQAGHKQMLNSSSAKTSDYPESSSRVIVRDVSVNADSGESSAQNGMRDPLVIQTDELNERIEAFFARSREQQRQDSLRRN